MNTDLSAQAETMPRAVQQGEAKIAVLEIEQSELAKTVQSYSLQASMLQANIKQSGVSKRLSGGACSHHTPHSSQDLAQDIHSAIGANRSAISRCTRTATAEVPCSLG